MYGNADCLNCPFRTQTPVPPSGTKQPRFIICLETPGPQESVVGAPAIGRTGYLLDKLLKGVGIDREECYITNAAKCMPTNKNQIPAATRCCQNELFQELLDVDCTEIIAFGNAALYTFTGEWGVAKWRGYYYPWQGLDGRTYRVHSTLHPSFLFRQPSFTRIVKSDLIHTLVSGPTIREPIPYLDIWSDNAVGTTLVVDVENTIKSKAEADARLDPLNMIGLASAAGAMNIRFPCHMPEDRRKLDRIKQLCENSSLVKVGHNLQHDLLSLRHQAGIELKGRLEDTMVKHAIAFPQLDHDLGFCFSQFWWGPRWKNYADQDEVEYNRRDTFFTYNLNTKLDDCVDKAYPAARHQYVQARDLDLGVAVRMRERGILTDSGRIHTLNAQYEKLAVDAQDAIHAIVPGLKIGQNGSTDAVKNLFFDTWGIKPRFLTENGEPSLNISQLQLICDSDPDASHRAVAEALIIYKKARLVQTNFLKERADPCIHATWQSSWRTVTGRWAAHKPNLQNQPGEQVIEIAGKELRFPSIKTLFIARPGMVLIEGDYSQLELRIAAQRANAVKLMQAFLAPEGVHMANAALLFPEAKGHLNKGHKTGAKNAAFGFGYNASDDVTAVWAALKKRGAKITYEGLQALRVKWFNVHSELMDEQKRTIAFARAHRYVEAYGGRREYFEGQFIDQNQALNFPVQATGAYLINCAITKLDQLIDWQDTCILAQIHDALVVECPVEALHETVALMKDCMEQTVTYQDRTTTFPVEFKYGPSLGTMTDYKK